MSIPVRGFHIRAVKDKFSPEKNHEYKNPRSGRSHGDGRNAGGIARATGTRPRNLERFIVFFKKSVHIRAPFLHPVRENNAMT